MRRWVLRIGLGLLLLPIVLVGLVLGIAQTGWGKGQIAALISDLGSSPGAELTVTGIDGFVPFDMTVARVSLRDRDGTWLSIDDARLSWAPSALIDGVAHVEAVGARRVQLVRPPIPGPEPEAAPPVAANEPGPLIPELPVDILVDRLSVETLELGAPILGGESATLSVSGSARLGSPADGVSIDLNARRIDDQPASLSLSAAFRPNTEAVDLELSLEEPAGGMVAGLLGRPDLGAVSVSADGSGVLDDWSGVLSASAGPQVEAAADVRIAAEAAGRRVEATVRADLRGLLDDDLAPAQGDAAVVELSLMVDDDGAIGIDTAVVDLAAVRLTAAGSVNPVAQSIDLMVGLDAGDPEAFAAWLDGAGWTEVRVDATASGGLLAPAVTATLGARGVRVGLEGPQIGGVALRVDAEPAGDLTDPQTEIPLSLSARLLDLRTGDPAVDNLLHPQVDFGLSGTATPAGAVRVDLATVTMRDLLVRAAGGFDGAVGQAIATLAIEDLGSIAPLVGQPLAGRLDVEIDGTWDPSGAFAAISARATDLATGIPDLDRLITDGARMEAAAAVDGDGVPTALDLVLDAGPVALTVAPVLTAGTAITDVDVIADIVDLALLIPDLAGAVSVSARVSGLPTDPAVRATLAWPDGRAGSLAIAGAAARIEAANLLNAPAIAADIAATLSGVPVSVLADATVEGEVIDLSSLTVAAGGAELDGRLRYDGATIDAVLAGGGDLAPLAPLLGQALAGGVGIDLAVSGPITSPDAVFSITGTGIAVPGTSVGSMTLDGTAVSIAGAPTIDATLSAQGVVVDAAQLNTVAVTARGDLSALSVTLDAAGEAAALPVSARTAATLSIAGAVTRIDVTALDVTAAAQPISLVAPAQVTIGPDGIDLGSVGLSVADGRIDVAGRIGPALDAEVVLSSLPVGLVDLFAPDLGLGGRIDGQVTASGPQSAATVAADLQLTGFTTTAADGLPTVDADIQAQLVGDDLAVDLAVRPQRGGEVRATGQVGLASERLELDLDGTLDLALLNAFTAAGGTRLAGELALDLNVAGPFAAPQSAGSIEIAGGRVENAQAGLVLESVSLLATGDRSGLEISRLSATTPGGGSIALDGRVGLTDGFPLDLRLTGREAVLLNTDLVTASVNLDVEASGDLFGTASASGSVVVDRVEIRIPEGLPASLPVIDVQEINAPPELAAAIAEREALAAQAAEFRGPPFGAGISLAIDVDANRVFVRGRGLDTEVGGDLRVRGSVAVPRVGGTLALRRGRLDLLGRRFDLEAGTVTLPGDASFAATLDFRATTPIEDGTGVITVTGLAADPEIAFSAEPELPQDEVLARILFGRSLGDLSPFQAASLARSVAELSGVGGGDLFGDVRSAFGLDQIDITGAESAADTSLSLGTQIFDNVSVGVDQGIADPSDSRVTIEVEITPNISLETDVGADASGRVGITYEFDY